MRLFSCGLRRCGLGPSQPAKGGLVCYAALQHAALEGPIPASVGCNPNVTATHLIFSLVALIVRWGNTGTAKELTGFVRELRSSGALVPFSLSQ